MTIEPGPALALAGNKGITGRQPTRAQATPRFGFVSPGCPRALVDSERMLMQLRNDGYGISPSYAEANLVIVNTCGFIDSVMRAVRDHAHLVAGDLVKVRLDTASEHHVSGLLTA